ncbi:MAG: hypothetical protein JXA71_03955 [Chitinispirillaceae bacterium]|nr:hypothetical protein [Chitinispirillaceae bacterium]
MIKTMGPLLLFVFAITAAGPSQNMVTVLLPATDGYLSTRESSRNRNELWVQGKNGVMSWIGFNLKGYTFSRSRTCMLCLTITAIARQGICDIHLITSPFTTAGKSFTRKAIRFDDLPLVSIPLDSSYSGQMLYVNITDIARSGAFHGIVLQSRGTLDATFSASEGRLSPAILCTHDIGDSNAVSWFSGGDRPNPQTGKKGDFMIRTATRTIYYKSGADWDSAGVIARPSLGKSAATPARRATLPASARKSR